MRSMGNDMESGYSKEYVDFERNEIYKELFDSMSGELKDADKYASLAESAETIGNNQLKQTMINLANQEISHFDEIKKNIEIMYPCLKQEVLYVLYQNLLDWKEDIMESISEIR